MTAPPAGTGDAGPTPRDAGRVPPALVRITLAIAAVGYLAIATYDEWVYPASALGRVTEWLAAGAMLAALAISVRRPERGGMVGVCVVGAELLLSVLLEQGDHSVKIVIPTLVTATGFLLGERAAVASGIAFGGGAVALAAWTAGPLRQLEALQTRPVVVLAAVSVAATVLTRAGVRSHRQALEASERARRRFLDLFRNAPDGLVALDAAGVVVEVNARAAEVLGGGPLPGQPLEAALAARGARASRPLAEASAESPALVELGKGPSARTLEVTARAIEAAEHPGPRTLLVLRDVTERHQLEAQLLHAQRLETVGQLAGGVAHDFNNLLTAVGVNAEALSLREDAETRALAAEILEAQRRGASLTRQLLAFARRDVRRPGPLDLAAAVREMDRLLRRLLAERNALRVDANGEAPVIADRLQLEQVVVNLVANARDASPPGAPVVVAVRTVGEGEARAAAPAWAGGPAAVLEVQDQGTGMSAETRARIFEPFFTTKPRGHGTGLGLATVHGIVAQSGGALAVETAPGRGSTFRVLLPLAASPARASEGSAPARGVRGEGERILVVEDDPAVRALVARALREAGYDVSEHAGGVAAIAALPHGPPPRLLLTDMAMPDLDGPEVARRARALAPGLPVLFMTGYFEASGAAGVAGLLRKPFSTAELLQAVRAALAGRAAGA